MRILVSVANADGMPVKGFVAANFALSLWSAQKDSARACEVEGVKESPEGFYNLLLKTPGLSPSHPFQPGHYTFTVTVKGGVSATVNGNGQAIATADVPKDA